MISPMNNKVVAYYRVSTQDQGIEGLGIEAQHTYVEALCQRGTASTVASVH
jgi:DNA invertase Pin-like site-specific DNA recombinase